VAPQRAAHGFECRFVAPDGSPVLTYCDTDLAPAAANQSEFQGLRTRHQQL